MWLLEDFLVIVIGNVMAQYLLKKIFTKSKGKDMWQPGDFLRFMIGHVIAEYMRNKIFPEGKGEDMWLPGVFLGLVHVVIAVIALYELNKIFTEGKGEGEKKPAHVDMPRREELSQEEIQQLVEEVQDVAEHVDTMNVSLENAVKQLRAAADYLDQVWKDCKKASAVGSGANVTGGVLSVLGGIATIMTWGWATTLLIAGSALGVAGTCTNLCTSAVETSANQSVIQEAEGAVQNANRAIKDVRERIKNLKIGKSAVHLTFLATLAIQMLGEKHLVVSFMNNLFRTDLLTKHFPTIMEALRAVPELVAKGGTKAVGKAGAEAGAKTTGNVIIGVSAAFLVLDTIELVFTVRDIVEDEGSDAARCLRCKADEYEAILLNQQTKTERHGGGAQARKGTLIEKN